MQTAAGRQLDRRALENGLRFQLIGVARLRARSRGEDLEVSGYLRAEDGTWAGAERRHRDPGHSHERLPARVGEPAREHPLSAILDHL
jgi:hypothetical protein